jgi:O-methyltransferase involved in polyketide biosynthesis
LALDSIRAGKGNKGEGVVYFEIDDAATLGFKQSQLEANYIQSNVRFISANYVTDGLINLLKQNGFDFARQTHFIWEGNTMYLTAESIRQVMFDIVHHAKHFTLSFDYMTEEVIAKTTGDPDVTRLVESFADMGAPWTYGFSSVASFAEEAGLTIGNNIKLGKLHHAYWPDEPMNSAIYDHYYLCTLESATG